MAIVRMKRLSLMAFSEDRDRILQLLAHIGVVEISETQANEGFSQEVKTGASEMAEKLSRIRAAQTVVKERGNIKKGLFSPRPELTERELLSSELEEKALSDALLINENNRLLKELVNERAKLTSQRESFVPWKELDTPLDTPCGKYFETTLCTLPKERTPQEIEDAIAKASELSEFRIISTGKELHYVFVVAHRAEAGLVRENLRQIGAAMVNFHGEGITAKEKLENLDREIEEVENKIKNAAEFSPDAEQYDRLLAAENAIETRLAVADAAEVGISSGRVFYVEGWCPAREEKMLSEVFRTCGCAYEFRDPEEGEEPPTLTYNSKLISPFETVTNMYSPPAYSGIDATPTMAPFFALFFGMMLSDAGYGLLLMLAGIFALMKMKPRGGFKNFMQLAVMCGASTVLWGLLFGGFFGDAIPSLYKLFTGKTFIHDTALWFNPMNDPMMMLVLSLALGGVQIVAGMAVKAYMMIRDGQVLDAIFDIGLWWVVFAGAITCIFNPTIGLYVLGTGAVGLVLTQGRAKKNIIMKFLSGVLSLYDITGYFSDILSYSRLLALSLSTAVVGNVINTMGLLTGPIGFFVVFIIGHVFNIAINLVGSFVHSARLQYVEYFGKFYESGGRLFAPLSIKTTNIDVIKEEI